MTRQAWQRQQEDRILPKLVSYFFVLLSFSFIFATVPPPSIFSANPIDSNSIEIKWRDNSTNEIGFIVYRGLTIDTGNFFPVETTVTNATSFSDQGLTNNTVYFYFLIAYNDSEQSVRSNFDSARTSPYIPINPIDTSAIPLSTPLFNAYFDTNTSKVIITIYDNDTIEKGYKIYQKIPLANYTQIANITSPIPRNTDTIIFIDSLITPDVYVTYKVEVYNNYRSRDSAQSFFITTDRFALQLMCKDTLNSNVWRTILINDTLFVKEGIADTIVFSKLDISNPSSPRFAGFVTDETYYEKTKVLFLLRDVYDYSSILDFPNLYFWQRDGANSLPVIATYAQARYLNIDTLLGNRTCQINRTVSYSFVESFTIDSTYLFYISRTSCCTATCPPPYCQTNCIYCDYLYILEKESKDTIIKRQLDTNYAGGGIYTDSNIILLCKDFTTSSIKTYSLDISGNLSFLYCKNINGLIRAFYYPYIIAVDGNWNPGHLLIYDVRDPSSNSISSYDIPSGIHDIQINDSCIALVSNNNNLFIFTINKNLHHHNLMLSIGIERAGKKASINTFNFYPNPFCSRINIVFPRGHDNSILQIFNINGKLINRYSCLNKRSIEWDVGNLSNGVYIFQYGSNANNRIVRKVTLLK